ncbi:MAG: hypothetical protein RIQ46_1721, partial [Pseudomonadota bacterium]
PALTFSFSLSAVERDKARKWRKFWPFRLLDDADAV